MNASWIYCFAHLRVSDALGDREPRLIKRLRGSSSLKEYRVRHKWGEYAVMHAAIIPNRKSSWYYDMPRAVNVEGRLVRRGNIFRCEGSTFLNNNWYPPGDGHRGDDSISVGARMPMPAAVMPLEAETQGRRSLRAPSCHLLLLKRERRAFPRVAHQSVTITLMEVGLSWAAPFLPPSSMNRATNDFHFSSMKGKREWKRRAPSFWAVSLFDLTLKLERKSHRIW